MNIEIEPEKFDNFLKLFAAGLMATFDMLPYLPAEEREKAAEALVQFREKIAEWQEMRRGDQEASEIASRGNAEEIPFYA